MQQWYVVHSKPRKEERLYNQFYPRGIDVYYPYLCTPRKMPYFPVYLFVNVDLERIGTSALQWIPGAIGVVNLMGEILTLDLENFNGT